MKTLTMLTPALAALLACAQAGAAPAPLRQDHPVVGTWSLAVPNTACQEIYHIHDDGTSLVTSAQEVAESEFQIADKPDKLGFYKEVDTITKDNGKHDCSGDVTEVGRSVTSYLLFHPSGDMFLMCLDQNTKRCIGPFMRVKGADT